MTTSRPTHHLDVLATTGTDVMLAVLEGVLTGSEFESVVDRFPVLRHYRDRGSTGTGDRPHAPSDGAAAPWSASIVAWESAQANPDLPFIRLASAGLADLPARVAVVLVAMADIDARFGEWFEHLQAPLPGRRPTLHTIASCLRFMGCRDGTAECRRLIDEGLLETDRAGDIVGDWPLRVPESLLDIITGRTDQASADRLGGRRAPGAADRSRLRLPEGTIDSVERAAANLRTGDLDVLVIRGPSGSDRLAAAEYAAATVGLATMSVRIDRPDLRLSGSSVAAAVADGRCPVIENDPDPGQTIVLPTPSGLPIIVVVGPDGGISPDSPARYVVIELQRLGPDLRRRCWTAALGDRPVDDLDEIVDRFHLPGRFITSVAQGAGVLADTEGAPSLTVDHVRGAIREQADRRLQPLATRLEPVAGWEQLVVDDETRLLLHTLERRCRHRERLADSSGLGTATIGVRALFSGPSGTGKTLAARALAAQLGLDVYRVELASIFDKYVGETEKNLHRVLSAAEQLDVVLLVDEGDSLFGGRTEVRSANDRYANLETNYLLQRIETYDGIIVVTTNARGSIDRAFERRMDTSVTFPLPTSAERYAIWDAHLPAGHIVEEQQLRAVSVDHRLTGGQIRNAARSATLAALDDSDGVVLGSHLEEAVLVEYRKSGTMAPGSGRPAKPAATKIAALMRPG